MQYVQALPYDRIADSMLRTAVQELRFRWGGFMAAEDRGGRRRMIGGRQEGARKPGNNEACNLVHVGEGANGAGEVAHLAW